MPRGQMTTEDRLRTQVKRLKNNCIHYREEIADLKQQLLEKDKTIEELQLQVAELRQAVFGKERSDEEEDDEKPKPAKKPKTRPASSYRRKKPKKNEITKQVTYPIHQCPDCGEELTNKKIHIRYEEDIVLAALTNQSQSTVEEQHIESGYCQNCKRRWHAKNIPPQLVTIGQQTRTFITYANYISRLSFSQIKDWLRDMYQLEISSGEIANILEDNASKLQPEYHRLLAKIRKKPIIHIDETSHLENGQKKWLWLVTPTDTEEAVYQIGWRGKGEALKLLGTDFNGVLVHDNYGAYSKLGVTHQLCWAHLIRKARDVAKTKTLKSKVKVVCTKLHQRLQALHDLLVEASVSDLKKLNQQLDLILRKNKLYPAKIVQLQNEIRKNRDRLFTCVTTPEVPTTNNKAERKLRPMVLKRKNSFGTRSLKGSQTFAVNASVVLSAWWEHRAKCLPKLYRMLDC
jgi:transposase